MAAELGKLSSAAFFVCHSEPDSESALKKQTLKRSDLVNEFEFRVTTVV